MVRGSRIEFLGGAGDNDDGKPGEGHITILPLNYDSIGQGTFVLAIDPARFHCAVLTNTSITDGDNISFKVYLDVGTYTLLLLTDTGPDIGITDIDIDAVEVASWDLYTVGWTKNIRNVQTGISIVVAGLKTLKVRVDGKNASGGGYQYNINYIALWRTA